MINLLPLQDKNIEKKEILRRFIAVLGLGLSFLLCAEIVFSLILLFFVGSFEKNLSDQVSYEEKLADLKNVESLESEAKRLNEFLVLFNAGEKETELISGDISDILSVLPSSLRINSLLFDKGICADCPSKIAIVGNADTRESLIGFISDLKLEERFREVESPISNLLAEKNVNFSLILDLENGK